MAQTYANRELVIIDDFHDRSFPDGVRSIPAGNVPVIYVLHNTQDIAEKRNLCCQFAKGEIITHHDSDDWSAPNRIADQVKRLEESGKSVVGYHSLLFHVERNRWMKYEGHANYAIGTSLCYRKSFWAQHPFRPGTDFPNVGEDNNFVSAAAKMGELASVDGGLMMVARVHEGQTNPTLRQMSDPLQQCYRPVEAPVLEGYEP